MHKRDRRIAQAYAAALTYAAVQTLLLVLAGCRPSPGPSVEDLADAFDQRVPGWLRQAEIPGANLAVIHDGEIVWTGAYGLADRESKQPMTDDTVFQVASISKPVTAWAVLRLVEEGRVELDAPVNQYLTRWQLPDAAFDPDGATVRRLLSHSAGLAGAVYSDLPPGAPVPPIEVMLEGNGHPDEAARLVHPPGSQFLYANPGYAALELLIEEVTGQPFAHYLDTAVLKPLGMTSSSFAPDADLLARTATGYLLDGRPAPQNPQLTKAPGGLYATVGDLARFVAAAMPYPRRASAIEKVSAAASRGAPSSRRQGGEAAPAGREVLQPESVSLLHTPVIKTEGMVGFVSDAYGLGHFLETLPTGERAVSHGGENTGWILQVYSVPEAGEGLVVLTNSERSLRVVARIIGIWARWCGFRSTRMSRTFAILAAVVQVIAALLAVGTAWLAWRLGQGLLAGERRLAPLARQTWGKRLSQVTGAGVLVTGWLLVGDVVLLPLLPVLAPWLAAAMIGCATMLVLNALLPSFREGQASTE